MIKYLDLTVSDSLSLSPRASPRALTWLNKHPCSMLEAIFPLAGIFIGILAGELSVAVVESVLVIPFVPSAIRPGLFALPLHFVVLPCSWIFICLFCLYEDSETLPGIILPISIVFWAICIFLVAFTVPIFIHEVTCLYWTIQAGLFAMAILLIAGHIPSYLDPSFWVKIPWPCSILFSHSPT